jgi:hypothetical protein
MPLRATQSRQIYVRYGSDHQTFGRPAEFKGGDVNAQVVGDEPFTAEEVCQLAETVARFTLSLGAPQSTVFVDKKVIVTWFKAVPPPNDGQNWELRR